MLLLFLAIIAPACGPNERDAAAHPHFPDAPVIVISIDTVRADHLSAFGGSGAATPHLDALAAESVVFENAWSHVPLTLPSHLSILTGTMPYEHGVRSNIGYVFDSAAHPTVPGLFRSEDRPTGAAVSAFVLRGASGIGAAFDFYDDAIEARPGVPLGLVDRSGMRTASIAAEWIERHADQPFFFLLHLFEPHAPYEPSAAFANAPSPYDGEIAAADAALGWFLERLDRLGLYDRAVIVVLSDHGEGLGDHGEPEHGMFLYRESLHVPLLIRLPGGARGGERVAAPVGLADVAPTLLRIAGMEPPAFRHARSLFDPPDRGRTIYAESMYPRIHLGWSDLRALVGERLHYIEAPRPELYDYVADPGETNNLLAEQRRAAADFRKSLEAIPEALAIPEAVDPEDAARLQALGYLGGISGAADDEVLPDPKDRIHVIRRMQEAMEAAATGRTGEAMTILRAILEENPGFTDGWTRLAMLLEEKGELREAVRVYQDAMRAHPRLAGEFALSLSSIYHRLGDLDAAGEHAELALRVNPASAHQNLGRIALERGDLAAAQRHAEQVRAHPTHRIVGSVLLAEVLTRQGRLEQALGIIEEARRQAALTGSPVESLEYLRGDILARLERFDEAIAAFRAEIAAFPQNRRPYIGLATVHRVRGDLRASRAAIGEMVAAIPGPESRRTAAVTLRRLDDPEGAARWE